MISVGQSLLPGLGRGELLAISVQHSGQHSERVPVGAAAVAGWPCVPAVIRS